MVLTVIILQRVVIVLLFFHLQKHKITVLNGITLLFALLSFSSIYFPRDKRHKRLRTGICHSYTTLSWSEDWPSLRIPADGAWYFMAKSGWKQMTK
mmetsp:Transcript_13401/g.25206  ORF Transcript_13401/g.25206 Transcript_13401/m.25206 type:complete len:96 (+) Transcript_13401:21-308(+)